ncbi:MAG: hypothetical protein NXI31_01730 [bacterium]|nr:hypothetical protein [bacterium]
MQFSFRAPGLGRGNSGHERSGFGPTVLTVLTVLAAPTLGGLITTDLPAQGLVHTGTAPGVALPSSGWTRSLTYGVDGTMWSLVFENDGSGTAAGRTLQLHRSQDDGATWALVTDVPTVGDGRGALVSGRACDRLHVTWSATDTGSYQSLYYQAFDTAAGQWVGSPELLISSTSSNDQYYANDIAITEQGTLGIVFNTHRSPTLSGFSGWSGGLLVKRRTDPTFQGPFRCNTDSFGMLGSMTAVGETFHTTFRTNTGLYGIRYRAYDTVAAAWVQAADVALYGSGQSSMRATNSSCITRDATGNLYVLYSVGSPNPAGGALEVAFAARSTGYSTWVTSLVETDPALGAGNLTYQHYSLAVAGDTVFAVFSRATDNLESLYFRVLSPDPNTGGATVTPDPASVAAIPLVLTNEADSFERVDGLRSAAFRGDLTVLYGGRPASQAAGYVSVLRGGAAARTLAWSRGCQGSLPALPRLVSSSLPAVGSAFLYGLEDAPANAPAIVFSGVGCLPTPQSLDPFGFTGCEVGFSPLASLFVLADPSGTATVSLSIPGSLAGGFELQFGALVLAPGANPGGAVATNALSASVR